MRTCWGSNLACSLCCLKVRACTGRQSPKTNDGEQFVRYHWQNYAHIPFRRRCYDPVVPTVFWPFIIAAEGLHLHPPCFYAYFGVSYRKRVMAMLKYKFNERSHLKVIAKVFYARSWRFLTRARNSKCASWEMKTLLPNVCLTANAELM